MPDILGYDHALGVITPSGNLVVERVTIGFLRDVPNVSAHFSRSPVFGTRDAFPDGYDLDGMLGAARLLAHAKPDAIFWSGSKGGAIGMAHDVDLKRRIEDATGIPATTSFLALPAAMARLGATRLALVTPYAEAYQRRLLDTFAREGIEVVAESHLGLTDNLSYAAVAPDVIARQIAEVMPARPDAVLTWCTNYAGAVAAQAAEASHGVPVLDAVTLPLWQVLGELGCALPPAAARWGRLFAPR
jgi:maleate isomerase